MKERPILFSGEMVRAILAGRKTQTRRVVTQRMNPHDFLGGIGDNKNDPYNYGFENPDCLGHFITLPEQRCPYGKIGDQLWVREAWHTDEPDLEEARSMHEDVYSTSPIYYRADPENDCGGCRWRPSIHMPRWASRIQLEITDIRVERLNDISEDDARAEGVPENMTYVPVQVGQEAMEALKAGGHTKFIERMVNPPVMQDWRAGFRRLWESINGQESLDQNPWVWVIEFKRIAP